MVPESKFGPIKPNMKVNGEITKPMEKASSGTLTETSTTESGRMIRQTATESICM